MKRLFVTLFMIILFIACSLTSDNNRQWKEVIQGILTDSMRYGESWEIELPSDTVEILNVSVKKNDSWFEPIWFGEMDEDASTPVYIYILEKGEVQCGNEYRITILRK